jgi:hypothetical protein
LWSVAHPWAIKSVCKIGKLPVPDVESDALSNNQNNNQGFIVALLGAVTPKTLRHSNPLPPQHHDGRQIEQYQQQWRTHQHLLYPRLPATSLRDN